MNKKMAEEILKYCNNVELQQFIIDYAAKNPEFEKAFMARFNPEKISSGSEENYVSDIESAFHNNMNRVGDRYNRWDNFGFDACAVAEDLKPLLEKADYYLQNNNVGEAILICRALIETIPDEWKDEGEDEDGDVQVVYDASIDKLEKILAENRLSKTQKETLFEWYREENKLTTKHEYVGLNTSLWILESYFTDTPEMLQKNLGNIEERINNAGSEYKREDAAISKINLLQKVGMNDEAESAITEYIRFKDVRKLRLEKLIKEKRYADAIELIKAGIKIAIQEKHPGTVNSWKAELLSIYKLQNNLDKILSAAEELFYCEPSGSRKYYEELKKYTSEKDWPATLERLLSKMDSGFFGFNDLKADIFIEHKMWDRLLALCEKSSAEKFEKYEKYLKPLYAKEIFDAYQKYVEKQALITDQNAYNNVGRVLKKMKEFEGGEEVVTQLLLKYREVYKRRKNMMGVLRGI
jgi:hypothetical protein